MFECLRFLRCAASGLALAGVLALVGCGGGRSPATSDTPSVAPLHAPETVVVDAAACEVPPSRQEGLIRHARVDGRCLRTFAGMPAMAAAAAATGPQQRALAAGTTLTPTVLFDWAEGAYAQYFPSHQANRELGVYTYRYYPETQNHVAVAGDNVYVQGPISGGALLYVGTVASFNCAVLGTDCPNTGRACAPVASWTVGAHTCQPNADQTAEIASGGQFTFLDSTGSTRGSATYTCTDGTLSVKGAATCEPTPPLACNTAGLTWTVATNTCVANPGEPTQIASGSAYTFRDSIETAGTISYACNDGDLTLTAVATCEPPTVVSCRVEAPFSWLSDPGSACEADFVPTQIAGGAIYTFTDTTGTLTGSDTYQCVRGSLTRVGMATCANQPRMIDSFGGDGGAADGGAAGDGTAGDGAPIVGGLVRVVDTTGKQTTATTDYQGYFRVKLTGMVPPLVVSVTRTDGVMRHTVFTRPLKINGYVFIAITGLTDKIASDVARAAGFPGATALTPAMVAANLGVIDESLNALRNDPVVAAAVLTAGLDPVAFDPLYTPYRADHTGYDLVLDNVVVGTDETGATVVRSINCPTPTSWTVGGLTCTPNPGSPAEIPSGGSVILEDYLGETYGSVGFSCYRSVVSAPILPRCDKSK